MAAFNRLNLMTDVNITVNQRNALKRVILSGYRLFTSAARYVTEKVSNVFNRTFN